MKTWIASAGSLALHLLIAVIAIYGISKTPSVNPSSEVIIDLATVTSSVKPHFDAPHVDKKQSHHEDSSLEKATTDSNSNPNPPSENNSAANPNATGSASEASLVKSYLSSIIGSLQAKKKYPQQALNQELEGVVEIEVIINAEGSLEKVGILKASPFEILNNAALETVKAAAPFPPPPNQREFHFVIPLRYHLNK